MDIISAYQQLGSYRGAAELCGTNHKTVKRVVDKFEADQAGVSPPARAERDHNYDAVSELVAVRVEKSQGRISAERLLPIARTAGYDGSDRSFRRLIAEAKRLWRSDNHRGRRPAVWIPGVYLVIDWATVGGLHLVCAVLAYSRWRFAAFATDEKATTTMGLIAEALAGVGGVPQIVLADRMGCLKGGVVANLVIPTPDYVRFATHCGFARTSSAPAIPNRKGSWRTWSATPNATWLSHCSLKQLSPGDRSAWPKRTLQPRHGVERSTHGSIPKPARSRRTHRC